MLSIGNHWVWWSSITHVSDVGILPNQRGGEIDQGRMQNKQKQLFCMKKVCFPEESWDFVPKGARGASGSLGQNPNFFPNWRAPASSHRSFFSHHHHNLIFRSSITALKPCTRAIPTTAQCAFWVLRWPCGQKLKSKNTLSDGKKYFWGYFSYVVLGRKL